MVQYELRGGDQSVDRPQASPPCLLADRQRSACALARPMGVGGVLQYIARFQSLPLQNLGSLYYGGSPTTSSGKGHRSAHGSSVEPVYLWMNALNGDELFTTTNIESDCCFMKTFGVTRK